MSDAGSNTKRIFSGVQPTGGLHLGNYLGAVRNFVDLQDDYECVYCVVDLHALTTWQDPTKLADQTREITAAFLASGIDPKRSIIFNQSQVRAHAELGWIFNCVARVGWLNRMTQFKDKAGKNREAASVGLYDYPVLQAADILAYLATHVPVGEDQKQHLELTRDIAGKFNNDFGVDFFPLIEPLILGAAARIMSLRDGSKKMSKSEPSDMSRINLDDEADAIANKIRRAKTDPQALPGAEILDDSGAITDDFARERPEAANLITIYASLGRSSLESVLNDIAGKSFSDFKGMLTERAVETMAPIGSEMKRLMNDPAHVDAVLKDGSERARAIADPVINQVYDIVGLLRA